MFVMRRIDKYLAQKLLEEAHVRGLVWTGSFRNLCRYVLENKRKEAELLRELPMQTERVQ